MVEIIINGVHVFSLTISENFRRPKNVKCEVIVSIKGTSFITRTALFVILQFETMELYIISPKCTSISKIRINKRIIPTN